MAGTRIKQCLGNYTADQKQVSKLEAWRLNPTAWVNDRPAFPVGVNAPHYPASLLANNYIDIETALRGIGANNYEYPRPAVVPRRVDLQQVSFYESAPVYIPKLPFLYQNQRPL